MKILFSVSRIGGGGMERVCAVIASALAERGHEVVIATTCHDSVNSYAIHPSVRVQNIASKYTGQGKLLSNLRGFFHRFTKLIRLIKREKPDLAITFMPKLFEAISWAFIARMIPVIASEHWNMGPYPDWKRHAKVKYVYRFLNCFTVLTHYDYNLLHNSLRNVVRMPNPINFIPTSDINQKREKVVLAAGRADAWRHKGFDNLIMCWAKLCKKHPDWTLKIAGKASDETLIFLNKIITDCKASNIEFLGFRNDIDSLMQHSEIFCLSSRAEGLPMVLLEAMNAGCCCVSFDVVTGPREIIDDNVNGLLAKNQDIDDLAMKLDIVMSDDELRHRLSANTHSALKEYSLDSVISRWETLFKKVLK